MSIIVTVRHVFALLSLVWHRYHFGTIFRTLWGSKHSFHGNITETHIDKRIGAAVFLWWRMKPQKLRGFQLANTIKRCQYIGDIGIHISRGICLISHYEADNKRLLSGFCQEHPLALPASQPASQPAVLRVCLSVIANGQQFAIRFYSTNGYIDLVQLFSSSWGETIRHSLI